MNRNSWNRLLKTFFVLNLLIILFFWLDGSGLMFFDSFGSSMIALGRLFGLLAVFFVLLQVILIGRTKWIEQLFGLDRLSRWHHNLGYFSIATIILHPLFLALGYGLNGKIPFFSQLWSFLLWNDVTKAAIATILFIIVVISSITIAKKKLKYETWYFTHLIVYAAIILAFGHQLAVGGDFNNDGLSGIFRVYWIVLYAFVLLNLLYFRFARPLWNSYKHKFFVDRIELANEKSVSIYVKGKNLEKFKIIPGQFMIWRFLQSGFWHEAHPFSISGYNLERDRYLRLTVKNLGDFTSKIHHIKPGTNVIIDGPHGIFTSKIAKHGKFLFIAGGVGITPIRAMLEELSWKEKDCVLLYAANNIKDLLFMNEFTGMIRKHPHVKIYYILSKEPGWKGETGYCDKEKIFRLVKDVKQRDVYVCGPPPMMESVLQSLDELGIHKDHIHYEKFSL